jgi:hypothetical protein
MSVTDNAIHMADDPAGYFGGVGYEAHHLPVAELAQLQRSALGQRFAALRDRIAVLRTLADEQKVGEFESLNDAVPLLFPHTMYKSYPASLLEKDRYDQLTSWLGRLTTCDLSTANVSACDGIDSWLDTLDRETDVRVLHSSGTTGTMTFLPRHRTEYETFFRTQRMACRSSSTR